VTCWWSGSAVAALDWRLRVADLVLTVVALGGFALLLALVRGLERM
jgi:hypothetical protein